MKKKEKAKKKLIQSAESTATISTTSSPLMFSTDGIMSIDWPTWNPNISYGNSNKIINYKIQKVIFQKEHTIILFKDGTREVVKVSQEEFDKEKGFAMAFIRHFFSRADIQRFIENATDVRMGGKNEKE